MLQGHCKAQGEELLGITFTLTTFFSVFVEDTSVILLCIAYNIWWALIKPDIYLSVVYISKLIVLRFCADEII